MKYKLYCKETRKWQCGKTAFGGSTLEEDKAALFNEYEATRWVEKNSGHDHVKILAISDLDPFEVLSVSERKMKISSQK